MVWKRSSWRSSKAARRLAGDSSPHLAEKQRNGGWNINSVRAAMQDETNPNRKEVFSRPMPVYLIYWTSTIMNDGRVRFDQDMYGHDRIMYQKFGIK